jgi:dihydrodipicolinate synthase/N-acetylneuraminate lyase
LLLTPELTSNLRTRLLDGMVIPAHPLALDSSRRLDERRQAALTRYYLAAGAGGVAVGVHTTQFAIRDPKIGLLEPVLAIAAQVAGERQRVPVLVAGICGDTRQALGEAELANRLGYDAGLVSLAALQGASNEQLLGHCRAIARTLPIFGFYLQPAVGGVLLDYEFWRAFFDIPEVVAAKVAPFNRYDTLDVVRALAESGRQHEIALYTGNDDNIVADLLAEFRVGGTSGLHSLHFAGGLLGQWAVWTKPAVELLAAIQRCRAQHGTCAYEILAQSASLTDANAAVFDARNHFAGCIAGLHEILRRQGLFEGRWCLDPHEDLSPGQMDEIDRVCRAYPHLQDDEFVAEHLHGWLR